MIVIGNFITLFPNSFPKQARLLPWEITNNLAEILWHRLAELDDSYHICDGIAIHTTAVIEKGAILKAPLIVGENCFVGSNTCLRGGVYLANQVKIGMGCEVKASLLFNNTAIAHFNFIGDSVIGSDVNFEAGSITANHYNERENKNISVLYDSIILETGTVKFGALVGDHSTIGANAVLSPGTLLLPNTIVKRLELIDQVSKGSTDIAS